MYSIKLDENKFWTGSYAKVGKVEGGVNIETLPPDMSKAEFYKYDYHDVTTVKIVPVLDEETGEFKTDELGNTIFEEKLITISVLEWIFDEKKYNEFLADVLSDIKTEKINELSKACNETIINGIDVQTSKGLEHFSLTFDDQVNIQDRYLEIVSGASEVLYHPDGDGDNCRMFTAQEIMTLALAAKAFKIYHTTYFNKLKALVHRCVTKDEIDSIVYGTPLPADLDESLVAFTGQSSIN